MINTGMTAINSHAILSIARDCVPLQGDVWIIYMGNNEVVGPFGAGSVFGARSPPLPVIRSGLAIKRTAVGQALDALWHRLAVHSRHPSHWEGMKMMVDNQIRSEDPALGRVYAHFARNLNDLLSAALAGGVKPIVCSVSSNLRDCAPFGSLHQPGLPGPRKAQWDVLLASGAALESKQSYAEALACYRQAAELDNSYADLEFRMARTCLALGQSATARDYYIRARDSDTLRFRSDTSLNRIVREVCARRAGEGVDYFDSEEVLTNTSPSGIAGEEWFWDHVHFNFFGNYLLAHGLADRIIALFPDLSRRAAQSGGIALTENQCAERLAFTDWDQRAVLAEMLQRVREPPFTKQLEHDGLVQRWSDRLKELQRKLDPDGLARSVDVYRAALARRPDDWMLHQRLGFLLESTGDLTGAAQQWQIALDLIPECVEACFKLGDVAARQGKPGEAESYYRRVLAIRPDSFEALNGLGLLLMDKDNLEEATRLFQQVLKINPKFAQVHVNWGLLESRRGRFPAAESHFREALRCDPADAAAHIDLGNLLAAQQKHAEAIDHFLQALQVRPNESTLHLALANSLIAVARNSEAVAQYQEALRLNPNLADAQFNLGVALAKLGNLAAATIAFQEACRLNPADLQAHLNFGVALAKQHRGREAIDQFQTVLRLDPANAAARQYLQTTIAKEGLGP